MTNLKGIVITLAIVGSFMMTGTGEAQEVNLNIIATIESNNNPHAYNYKSEARGLCQITPICVNDYMQHKKMHFFNMSWLYKPEWNFEIADWYLNKMIPKYLHNYHLQDTLTNRLWAYNAGIGNVVKGILPKETKNYIKKYEALNKEIK